MKWITCILFFALVFLQWQIWFQEDGGLRHKYIETNQKVKQVQQQNADLRQNNQILKAQLEDLQNGHDALSEIIRTKLNYIEQGEIFYDLASDRE